MKQQFTFNKTNNSIYSVQEVTVELEILPSGLIQRDGYEYTPLEYAQEYEEELEWGDEQYVTSSHGDTDIDVIDSI